LAPRELRLHERVIGHFKQLHFERRSGTALAHMAAAPDYGVKDDLCVELHDGVEFLDDRVQTTLHVLGHGQIHVAGGARHSVRAGGDGSDGHELDACRFRRFEDLDHERLESHAPAGFSLT
jgi:hypothetical protein